MISFSFICCVCRCYYIFFLFGRLVDRSIGRSFHLFHLLSDTLRPNIHSLSHWLLLLLLFLFVSLFCVQFRLFPLFSLLLSSTQTFHCFLFVIRFLLITFRNCVCKCFFQRRSFAPFKLFNLTFNIYIPKCSICHSNSNYMYWPVWQKKRHMVIYNQSNIYILFDIFACIYIYICMEILNT